MACVTSVITVLALLVPMASASCGNKTTCTPLTDLATCKSAGCAWMDEFDSKKEECMDLESFRKTWEAGSDKNRPAKVDCVACPEFKDVSSGSTEDICSTSPAPAPGPPSPAGAPMPAPYTGTTTMTAWDSSLSSSGSWYTSSDSSNTSLTFLGSFASSSLGSDSGLWESSGGNKSSSSFDSLGSSSGYSGSSGSYLPLWEWIAIICIICCCKGAIIGALTSLMGGDKKKATKKKKAKSEPKAAAAPEPVAEPLVPAVPPLMPLATSSYSVMPVSYAAPAYTTMAAPAYTTTAAYAPMTASYTTGVYM